HVGRSACAEQIELAEQFLDSRFDLFALAAQRVQLFREILDLLLQFGVLFFERGGHRLRLVTLATGGAQITFGSGEFPLKLFVIRTKAGNDLNGADDALLQVGKSVDPFLNCFHYLKPDYPYWTLAWRAAFAFSTSERNPA